jgi:hypothetical protein
MITVPYLLPGHSFLFHTLKRCDYLDTFQVSLIAKTDRWQTRDLVQAFLTNRLVGIYQRLVVPNRLGSDPVDASCINRFSNAAEENNLHKEEAFPPFRIFTSSSAEIVIGEDSRYLSFRISFSIDRHPAIPSQQIISVTTMVQFNHWLGRFYFSLAKPFQKLAVQGITQRMQSVIQRQQPVYSMKQPGTKYLRKSDLQNPFLSGFTQHQ